MQIVNYNADGQRILKDVRTDSGSVWQFYVYDGLHTLGVIQNGQLQYLNILGYDVAGRVVASGGAVSAGGDKRYYLKDMLGSVRAVVNQTGDVKENRDYGPWGILLDERQYVEGAETAEKFSGKELDEQTGWFHFGQRDLMAILGRWPSPDRFADKYPSLSPYSYAANDPIGFIDVNGDSVYVENRVNRSGFWGTVAGFFGLKKTETYVYRGGNWFDTKTSNQVSMSSDFLGKVSNAVNSLEATSSGSKLVSAIATGVKDVTVTAGSKNGFRGTINKGTVKWNPSLNESGLNTAGNTKRPPFIGLGHEFAHAYDIFGYDSRVGVTPGNWGQVQTPKGPRMVGLSEMYASIVENMIRKQAGIPLRTHYGINKATNSGVLPIPFVNPAWFNF